MSLPDRESEPALVGGDDNQVDVIGHQTVRPDLHASFPALLGKAVAINVLVAIFEENRLSTIAALRHVMRAVRNDDASETGHARAIA